jgi:hypothetical protein
MCCLPYFGLASGGGGPGGGIWLCWRQNTKYRVPQCMSPCRNWDSPTPSFASECAPPPGTIGGRAHLPAGEGLGESQFRQLEKKLSTLPTLCARRSRIRPQVRLHRKLPLPHPTHQISDFSHRCAYTVLPKIGGIAGGTFTLTMPLSLQKSTLRHRFFPISVLKDGILYFRSEKTSCLLPLSSQRSKGSKR